jgi:hypothetical protein
MAKDTRIQFRVSEEKKRRFDHCAEVTGLDATALGEAAVEALCDYIELHGEITMPLVILHKSALAKTAALPAQSGRSDAPVALPANPSTDSIRFSVNEEPAPARHKSKPPRARSTRAGIHKIVEHETKKGTRP